jgi:hypothetical protein
MSIRQSTPKPSVKLTSVAVGLFTTLAVVLLGVALYALVGQTALGSLLGSVVTVTPAFVGATVMGLLLVAVFFAVRRVEPNPGR